MRLFSNIDLSEYQSALVAMELWVIDNGKLLLLPSLFGKNFDAAKKTPFKYKKDHFLLPQASQLDEADIFAKSVLK